MPIAVRGTSSVNAPGFEVLDEGPTAVWKNVVSQAPIEPLERLEMEYLIIVDGRDDDIRPVPARSAEEALDLVRADLDSSSGRHFRFLPVERPNRRLVARSYRGDSDHRGPRRVQLRVLGLPSTAGRSGLTQDNSGNAADRRRGGVGGRRE
ncbi:hypothetical protein WCD74_22150 [Actinomycetospora sp. OC33-EN08]|uniref:Uncharacterized protein n=1 Tax=Actinomycetospora aurantiaca TaxID=3129233 RepID=A0ABU8MV79_9PSEU